jgi:predicted nucleic acid-binding protein
MHCLDSTFCIDFARGLPAAKAKVAELEKARERLSIPAPALTEFLTGAFSQGGKRLLSALEFVSHLETLEVSESIALDAARLGGECIQRGDAVATIDLLIAATARHYGAILLSRDSDFSRIPGITVQTY